MTPMDPPPSSTTATQTSSQPQSQQPVNRRRLLRGAGLAAGAAGAAALLAAAPSTAQAADGDPVMVGKSNEATSTTTITTGTSAAADQPTLSLQNASGPTLELEPLPSAYRGQLEVGQIVNQTTGPVIGVDNGEGPENTYIALGSDIAQIPTPYAFDPVRLLDTRRPASQYTIVNTSPNAFDSAHRLKPGAWLDLGIVQAADIFTLQGVFVNVTVTGAASAGFITVGAPGPRPGTSSLNYGTAQTIANAGFFPVGTSGDFLAIRIHASTAATHVVLDLTGYTVTQQPGPLATAATKKAARMRRQALTATTARRRLSATIKPR